MSAKDPLTIFLAIMTFISTMTGVVSTFVTYAQFRREAAARDAVERENAESSGAADQKPGTPRRPRKVIPAFSFALKSKMGMSVGFIVLAVILGAVWRGTASVREAGLSHLTQGTTNSTDQGVEEDSVNLGDSKNFLGGQLYISLNVVDMKGDPARAFATFTVGTSAGKSKRIKGEEAGFIMDFEDFNVRLLSASAGEARFAVKKNAK